jgi:amino acid adenylation domain-containing protein
MAVDTKEQKAKKPEIDKVYSLTPMQEGMLFQTILDEKKSAYLEQTILEIEGTLDVSFLENSLNAIVNRYDVFRTIFSYKKVQKPRQIVLKERRTTIQYVDLSAMSEQEKQNYTDEYVKKDAALGFRLEKDIPMRISVIKTDSKAYKLIWSFHHIVMDGWCVSKIVKELFTGYLAQIKNVPLEPAAVHPYYHYLEWMNKQDRKQSKAYWENYLSGYENTAILPRLGKGKTELLKSEELEFAICETLTAQLNAFARSNDVTMNTLFQAVWGILLQRFNNTDDVVFGAVVSGRPPEIQGVEEMVGLFINTVPVRINGDQLSFMELINNLQELTSFSRRHEYYSLYEIQANSILKQDLIDHIIAFENYPIDKELEDSKIQDELGFTVKKTESRESLNYNLYVVVGADKELYIRFHYNAAVYKKEFMQKIEGYLETVFQQIVENPNILVKDIEVVPAVTKNKLLVEYNQTKTSYPKEKTITALFEERVLQSPDHVALSFKNNKMTYQTLNEKANRFANALLKRKPNENPIVGLVMDRSMEMIVAIIGILKAGRAYLPIEPGYPKERILTILNDSGTTLLVTDQKTRNKYQQLNEIIKTPDYDLDTFFLEDIHQSEAGDSELLSKCAMSSKALAYVMYTSGSTGQPKGNLTTHYNVIRVVKNTNYIKISHQDKLLQLSNYAFDGSTFDIFAALLNGAELVLIEKEDVADVHAVSKIIAKENVTVFFITSALFNALVDINVRCLSNVRKVIVGGDQVSFHHAQKALRILGKGHLLNGYGPTESTVFAVVHAIDHLDLELGAVPIGKPIANTQVYILNKHLKIQPEFAPGELYIAGDGLIKGYLNDQELTKKKFINNPYQPDQCMYQTGDLGRWLLDGTIEFIGRVDTQIKLRGFRIELGEIEAKILSHEQVRETAVMIKTDATNYQYICAYIVTAEGLLPNDLKEYLSKQLPDFMMPSHIEVIDRIPLTSNGKIDKKAFPIPERNFAARTEYEAPVNEMEVMLVKIWEEILNIPKIGVLDNFFELGGHSLLATTMVARIHKENNIEVPVREVFRQQTVRKLAQFLVTSPQSNFVDIKRIADEVYPSMNAPTGYYPVSSAQKRMYVMSNFEDFGVTYNIPVVLKIEGEIDKEQLENAFTRLVERHEALRTSFEMIDGVPYQKINNKVKVVIEYKKAESDINKIMQDFVRPFDIGCAPLFRIGLVLLEPKKYLLLFDIYHIIADGTSITILIQEWIKLYTNEQLPNLKLQYKDFSIWQNHLIKAGWMKEQENYWLNRFAGELPILNLPTDYPRPIFQSFEGDTYLFELEEKYSKEFKLLLVGADTTLYMGLLAVFHILLSKYCDQEDIVIGTQIAGRHHADLDGVLGTFANTLLMRNFPKREMRFEEFLSEVKENALTAYENQDYQFEELVEKLDFTRDISRNPLFDVMFILQNINDRNITDRNINKKSLNIESYEFDNKVSRFDLTLCAQENKDKIKFSIEYCTKLYQIETIRKFSDCFKRIIMEVIKNPKIKLSEISILSEHERHQVLYGFNKTAVDYDQKKTIQELFEEQVKQTPTQTALIFGNTSITYELLNEKANQLAHTLREMGVTVGQIIPIIVEHSVEMIVGILGILKSGGAYLPITPDFPLERIKIIISDCNALIIIAQRSSQGIIQDISYTGRYLFLEEERTCENYKNNPLVQNNENDLAYVIYTSGSSGKPKGVMIEHRAFHNFLIGMTEKLDFSEAKRILALATITFDISTLETIVPLLRGMVVLIANKEQQQDPYLLNKLLSEQSVHMLQITPSRLKLLLKFGGNLDFLSSLTEIMIGGEALSQELFDELVTVCGDRCKAKIYNMYGPTETTVWSTVKELTKNSIVNIGKPIVNTQIYIVDQSGQPVPIGIAGELCIAGDGLARGYFKREELTKEKFVWSSFLPKTRLYKTGDLAKWNADGALECLGRIDDQVKIRGYRIELQEIEAWLLKYENIEQAVVIERQDKMGNKYLSAYIVSLQEISSAEIRAYLAKYLPDYMVPTHIAAIDKIPINTRGKVERQKLPDVEHWVDANREYCPPKNDKQKKMVEIWQEVFDQSDIGILDNFLALGGDSIKAIHIASLLKKKNLLIQVKDVFIYPTIEQLSHRTNESNMMDTDCISEKPTDFDNNSLTNEELNNITDIVNKL